MQGPVKESTLDQLLSKYVSVWLWSILFGTTTGVLYSFLSFRLDRWGGLGIAIAVPAVISLALALMSWSHLYWGLKHFLIPTFIFPAKPGPDTVSRPPVASDVGDLEQAASEERQARAEEFGFHLRRALALFIAAAASRALVSVLELLLASGKSFG